MRYSGRRWFELRASPSAAYGEICFLRPIALAMVLNGLSRAEFVMSVLRWHVDKQLITRDMERSELPFPIGGGRVPVELGSRQAIQNHRQRNGSKKQISPCGAHFRTRCAKPAANVVVRSISGHLTEQMQQRLPTARGHEQESAIARIVDPNAGETAHHCLERRKGGTAKWTAQVDSMKKPAERLPLNRLT